jgi:hypothetical protein
LLTSQKTIHNPGVIPDPRYNDTNTDITVIFEETYAIFQQRLPTIKQQPKNRSRYAFFINSLPSQPDYKKFVDDLSQLAEWLYVTEETVNFYESFGKIWSNWTADLPTDKSPIVYNTTDYLPALGGV